MKDISLEYEQIFLFLSYNLGGGGFHESRIISNDTLRGMDYS